MTSIHWRPVRALFALFVLATVLVISAFQPSRAADESTSARRAEIRRMCDEALAALYLARPALRARVAAAPGYGCFSNIGLSVLMGGAGGRGLVHDNVTGTDTSMAMAQASIGVEFEAQNYREVLVFTDPKVLRQFVDSGWEVSGSGGAAAGVQGRTGGVEHAAALAPGIEIYPMTRTGLAIGASIAGRKYWKERELTP
jgi:lipid-binding SYLF domain-containing protein